MFAAKGKKKTHHPSIPSVNLCLCLCVQVELRARKTVVSDFVKLYERAVCLVTLKNVRTTLNYPYLAVTS